MEKLVSKLIPIYILYCLFYGIIIKITIKSSILFKIKTVIPELILLTLIICGVIKIVKNKFNIKNKYAFTFLIYIIFVFTINIILLPKDINSIFYVIRDLIMPIFVMFILFQFEFKEATVNKIIKNINKIFIFFIIVGFALALIQSINGWEWSSKFYTGYPFYGSDPISKIKIWESGRLLRTPSVTGNSAIFGEYCLIALLFILKIDMKKYQKITLVIISLMTLFLSTSKTPLIIAMIIIMLNILRNNNKLLNKSIFIVMIILSAILLIIILNINPEFLFSIKERFMFWTELFQNLDLVNLMIPLELFNITSSAEGVLGFVDNTYIYFLYATGVIGLILFIANAVNLYRFKAKYKISLLINEMIISLFIMSLFTNITQGRSYFTMFILLIPILNNKVCKFNSIKIRRIK